MRDNDVSSNIVPQESLLLEGWLSAQCRDLGLTKTLYTPAGTEYIELLPLNEVCTLPPGHPLATKKVLTPDDFHGKNYISFSHTDSYRRLLDQSFTENQVKRHMIVEARSATSVYTMVRAGVGVSVVSPLTALDYAASGLVVQRFSIAIPFAVGLIRPLHRPSSTLVQVSSEHLRAGLPKLVTSPDVILSSATAAQK